jgi:hypothetical protein
VTLVVVTCLIAGFTVVIVGFLISGFLISGFGASGLISGVFSRQGHSGQVVHVPATVPVASVGSGQLVEAQLNSVNDSSPSKVPSLQVLSSEVQVVSPVFDVKNSLDVPFAKTSPLSSQLFGSCRVHVFEGSGS